MYYGHNKNKTRWEERTDGGKEGRKGWSDGGKGGVGFVFSCLLMELEIQKSNAMYLDFL